MNGVGVTKFAPEAPTLMGAMNLAALNVDNGVGAWGRRRCDRRRFRLAVSGLGRLRPYGGRPLVFVIWLRPQVPTLHKGSDPANAGRAVTPA
jgi:hypothetical protein